MLYCHHKLKREPSKAVGNRIWQLLKGSGIRRGKPLAVVHLKYIMLTFYFTCGTRGRACGLVLNREGNEAGSPFRKGGVVHAHYFYKLSYNRCRSIVIGIIITVVEYIIQPIFTMFGFEKSCYFSFCIFISVYLMSRDNQNTVIMMGI